MKGGIRYARKGAVATISIDTPDSPVNVLTEAAAEALTEALARARNDGARAVVLRSDKPRSFLNGARLLAAASMRSEAEARAQATAMRRAYDALFACPLPTVAVVEGSCFGCGMELTLCCDYRVGSESGCTQFYMTEVPDYLITPVFGSTQRLPRLIGFTGAVEILLWGRRLRGRDAMEVGLLDAVLGAGREERFLAAFLGMLAVGGWKKGARVPAVESARGMVEKRAREEQRIAGAAPAVRSLLRRALALVALPFTQDYTLAMGLEAELGTFCDMVLEPRAAKAITYFFARQTARLLAAGSVTSPLPERINVLIEPGAATALIRDRIGRRPVRGLGPQPGVGVIRFHTFSDAHSRARAVAPMTPPSAGGVTGDRGVSDNVVVCQPGEVPPTARPALLVPFPHQSEPGCELSLPVDGRGSHTLPAGLMSLLEVLDLQPVATRPAPEGRWVSERLIDAYLRPVAAWAKSGGSVAAADHVLREFGFEHSPGEILRWGGLELCARFAHMGQAGQAGRVGVAPDPVTPALVGAVLDSLRDEGLACLAERVVDHPSQLDVLARVMLGFPLAEGTLMRHLEGTGRMPARARRGAIQA